MEEKRPDERQLIESQKHYSDDGLWEKVKTVAKKAGLQVIYLALILFYTASAPTTPTSKKSVIYGALGYFILPIDLILDAIPKAKELMDQWRFSLTDVRINSEEVTLVGAIRQD